MSYESNIVQLSQMGYSSTVTLLQAGWQPALVEMLISMQVPKSYSGFGLHGLFGLLSKFLMSYHFQVENRGS